MVTVVSRVMLGICSAIAMVGGALLVVKAAVYFGADHYLSALAGIVDLLFAGVAALGLYAGGAIRTNVAARIAAGVGIAFAGFVVSSIAAAVLSLVAHRGGPQGNLEDGILGFIWFVACAFFVWSLATRRWPAVRRPAP